MTNRVLPLRFPVLWITMLAFGIVAAATMDLFLGGLLLVVVLPLVLLGQWCVRWFLGRLRAPVWLRRSAMLLPALLLAFRLFPATSSLGRDRAAVSFALAGHIPSGIRELQVWKDNWTDYVVIAYFRCDPASLRSILEQAPFIRSHNQPGTLSFVQTPFTSLHNRPDAQGVVVFRRTDLESAKGHCEVYTDSAFSFAHIRFGVD